MKNKKNYNQFSASLGVIDDFFAYSHAAVVDAELYPGCHLGGLVATVLEREFRIK